MTITEALKEIRDNIVRVLSEAGKPLTDEEIYAAPCFKNKAWQGFAIALQRLVREEKIAQQDDDRYFVLPAYNKIY